MLSLPFACARAQPTSIWAALPLRRKPVCCPESCVWGALCVQGAGGGPMRISRGPHQQCGKQSDPGESPGAAAAALTLRPPPKALSWARVGVTGGEACLSPRRARSPRRPRRLPQRVLRVGLHVGLQPVLAHELLEAERAVKHFVALLVHVTRLPVLHHLRARGKRAVTRELVSERPPLNPGSKRKRTAPPSASLGTLLTNPSGDDRPGAPLTLDPRPHSTNSRGTPGAHREDTGHGRGRGKGPSAWQAPVPAGETRKPGNNGTSSSRGQWARPGAPQRKHQWGFLQIPQQRAGRNTA